MSKPGATLCDYPDEAAPLWRVTPGQALRYRQWQGEYVLYNDLSGDTHLLGADAIALLLALQCAPATAAALTGALGAWPQPEAADDDAPATLLTALQALALIEAVA